MRVKIVVLLGFVASVGAMEVEIIGGDGLNSLGGDDDRPLLKLAQLKKRSMQIDSVSPNPNSPFSKYESDAQTLITTIPFLEREYPEEEVSKTFKYYDDTYPTYYDKFLARVNKIKDGSESSENYKKDVIIEFLQLMHGFRYDKAHDYKADKVVLIKDKEVLTEQKEVQVTKTKYANWRSYGAGIGGAAATFLTGFLTWYLKQPAAAACVVANVTARLI